MTGIEDLKGGLRRDLATAMKQRDRDTASTLRTALAALDNAEAIPVPANEQMTAGQAVAGKVTAPAGTDVAGASLGAGSTEVRRRAVTGGQAREILNGLIAEQEGEADRYDALGQASAAQRLRAQADVLRTFLGRIRAG